MNKTQLKKARLAFLKDTVDFYSADPEGRRSMDKEGETCRYRSNLKKDAPRRCAIGRWIPDENYVRTMDSGDDTSFPDVVEQFPNMLPENIRALGDDFLWNVQRLHDEPFNWDEDGLTKCGLEEVIYIKDKVNKSII